MIAKHTLGRSFYGLLAYVLREGMAGRETEARLLGGNMSGQHARELAREFAVFRGLNRAVRRPVFHASLRLPVGESLTDAQWRWAAREYLEHMGYRETAYVVARHPENHIHIVASRVRFNGAMVNTWQDRWRGLAAMGAIERRFGLAHPLRPTPASRGRGRHTEQPEAVRADRLAKVIAGGDGREVDYTGALTEVGAQGFGNLTPVNASRKPTAPGAAALPTSRDVAEGDRGRISDQGLGPTGASVPPTLVAEARASLGQHHRWNGHLGAEAVLRLAATHLIGRHPRADLSTVLAALDAARPGSLARYPGGGDALLGQLHVVIAARARDDASAQDDRQYPTR